MTAPLKPLESQLHDAMAELEHHYSEISAKPSSMAEYDEGADIAESLIEIAKRISLLADAIAAERKYYRADFVEAFHEKAMDEAELFGVQPHHLI